MDIYIYALKSGKTILYVGRTCNPLSRFKSHITRVRNANKSTNLYRDLFNRVAFFKTLPEMIILKVCNKENANFWEAFYCKKYSKKFELYNSHFVCSVGGNYKPVIEIEKRLQIKNFLKNKHLQQGYKRIYFNKKKIAIKNI
jgi:hypothetical protein